MADFNFIKTLQALGEKQINLVSDTIKIILCTAAWTPSESGDDMLSDIPSGALVGPAVTLSSKSFTNAIFDAADLTFTGLGSGKTVTQAAIYKSNGGSPDDGPLIRKISGDSYSGFPFTTNGLDVNHAWPNDADKIFAMVNV